MTTVMGKKVWRLGMLTAMLLALSACTSLGPGVSVARTGDNPAPTVVPEGTDPNDDVLGRREHPRIIAAYGGVYEDRQAEIMVARIVGRLLAAANQPNVQFQVTILDTSEVNAFALPGGYIYVTRGILALASDTSELAAVLAHEIAHVTLRHARARTDKTRNTQIVDRVVTGIFGGVIGSIVLAIATDLFSVQLRGRVMGLIQTAFGASQVLGLPIGLYLSSRWDWHAPFLVMVAFGAIGGLVILFKMKSVADHLAVPQQRSAFLHLLGTIRDPRYLAAFATTALLTTGGFMIMPFSSAFTVNNIGISIHSLPTIYFITGIFAIIVGPLVGKAADAYGKLPVFIAGSLITCVMVIIYTHLTVVPLATVIVVNVLLFVGIFSRLIPFQAMVSSVPEQNQRGAFNAVGASIQQFAGGFASVIAGHIVSFGADGKLQHFPMVGYVVVLTVLLSATLTWRIQHELSKRAQP